MKYLTKEWYELSQRMGLHFDMKVHNGADIYDEALYLSLYKRKEKEFVKMQHEVYDSLSPFDEKKCREEFRNLQEMLQKVTADKLSHELLQQIADMRVFSLGYCTKEILRNLKRLSKENKRKVDSILNEYSKAQQAEHIPQIIRERFGFHDCEVKEFAISKNIVMGLDTRGGFTDLNMIIFTASEIMKQDEHIVGSKWIYDELYRMEKGYEAHMLFWVGEETPELIIRCNDIIIEKGEAV